MRLLTTKGGPFHDMISEKYFELRSLVGLRIFVIR